MKGLVSRSVDASSKSRMRKKEEGSFLSIPFAPQDRRTMEQYTAADGSALPDEPFDEYWRWRQEFVCSSTDIETLRGAET